MKLLNKCTVCGSEMISDDFIGITNRNPADNKSWPVMKCLNCGHGFMNPQPEWRDLSIYYSSSYEAYDSDHGSESENDSSTVENALNQGAFRHLSLPISGKSILDVGCGGGYFLRIAQKLGAKVQGVEPSDAGSKLTASQGISVFKGTLDSMLSSQSDKTKFDIITANHVLEHTPDPVATLRQMKSLLAPGGYIWISVPNAKCHFARLLGKEWHSMDLPYHLQQFTTDSLVLAGKRAGLTIQRSYTYSLPQATASSYCLYLRKRYFIPQRISRRFSWLNDKFAPKMARQLDSKLDGEAIIIEFAN